MHCLTAVKSDLSMILSIFFYIGLLVRAFSSFKFPFMYSDMQVHKRSRLNIFCDVPFKLGKITHTFLPEFTYASYVMMRVAPTLSLR